MKPQELEDLKHAAAERYHRDPQFHARTRVAANILDLTTLEGWDAKLQAAAIVVEALDRTSYQLQPTPAATDADRLRQAQAAADVARRNKDHARAALQ